MHIVFSDVVHSPNAAVRCSQFILDRSSVEMSRDLIGRSANSEVLRGYLNGQVVAVKRFRENVTGNVDTALKDLVSEMDIMCRCCSIDYKPLPNAFLVPYCTVSVQSHKRSEPHHRPYARASDAMFYTAAGVSFTQTL